MLAPLARRIALARPVATAFQSRPFGASSPPNDNGAMIPKIDTTRGTKDPSEFKRMDIVEHFGDYVDAAGRAELAKIRDIEDEIHTRAAMEVEPIDWDHWRKEIKHPGIVDQLKVMYEESPPITAEEETKRVAKTIEDTFNPILEELKKVTDEAAAEAEEYEKRAEELSYLQANMDDMTVDEFLEKYPTVKARIESDIENGKWFVED